MKIILRGLFFVVALFALVSCIPSQVDPNSNPIISSINLSDSNVGPGDTVVCIIEASDPDGDDFTFSYTVTGGTVEWDTEVATWTLPMSAGSYDIQAKVEDELGGQTNKTAIVSVYSKLTPSTLYEPTDKSSSYITLDWSQNNEADFAYYKLYRSNTPNVTENSTELIKFSNKASTYYTNTSLDPGTTYYYKIFTYRTYDIPSESNEVATRTYYTGEVIHEFNTPDSSADNSPVGIAFDEVNLWIAIENGKIYEVDTDGNVLSSFQTSCTRLRDIDWDGSNVWCSDAGTKTLYQYSTDGSELSSCSTSDTIAGMYIKKTCLAFTDMTYNCENSQTLKGRDFDCIGNFFGIDNVGVFEGLTCDCGNNRLYGVRDGEDDAIYWLNGYSTIYKLCSTPGTSPTGIAPTNTGFAWITDSGTNKIYYISLY